MADALTSDTEQHNPWRALWALCLGFFMILVDSTIVSVATPAIMTGLHADVNAVVWVTSAYLLAFAVPLLITGRLGDRLGPKNVYLVGLAIFTAASFWCGFTDSIAALVTARVVQGLGASLMTPQTMSVITRIFPAERRGKAMGAWGAVAGVATLVGPILGGFLIDTWGWEWIFYINVPVGVIGFALAWIMVPSLPVHSHKFDWTGVLLSAIGMFLLVFGIQEGQEYDWGQMTGIISVPLLIILGVVVMVAFVVWQRYRAAEPLVPLVLFKDRNFSLANMAITTVGFGITAMAFPLMLYAQTVRGMSPMRSAMLLIPMAVLGAVLAPSVGRMVDRMHPALLAGTGLLAFTVSLVWLGLVLRPGTAIWQLELPIVLLGIANAFMWSPLSVAATRTLPPQRAGAGSGVYNMTRQVGAVLGSAAIAVIMESRLTSHLGATASGMSGGASGRLPVPLRDGFARAMGESLYLPAAVVLVGFVAALFFSNPHVRTRLVKSGANQPSDESSPVG